MARGDDWRGPEIHPHRDPSSGGALNRIVTRHRSTAFPARPLAGRASKAPRRDGGPGPSSVGPEIGEVPPGGPRNHPHEIGGVGGGGLYHTARSRGAESMRLALDVLEGQNFARKNHHASDHVAGLRGRYCSKASLKSSRL
jgi:hypothetical protein